jgi:hypothetical protein
MRPAVAGRPGRGFGAGLPGRATLHKLGFELFLEGLIPQILAAAGWPDRQRTRMT